MPIPKSSNRVLANATEGPLSKSSADDQSEAFEYADTAKFFAENGKDLDCPAWCRSQPLSVVRYLISVIPAGHHLLNTAKGSRHSMTGTRGRPSNFALAQRTVTKEDGERPVGLQHASIDRSSYSRGVTLMPKNKPKRIIPFLGWPVQNKFPGHQRQDGSCTYNGHVIKYVHAESSGRKNPVEYQGWWKLRYEDGDESDVTLDELVRLLYNAGANHKKVKEALLGCRVCKCITKSKNTHDRSRRHLLGTVTGYHNSSKRWEVTWHDASKGKIERIDNRSVAGLFNPVMGMQVKCKYEGELRDAHISEFVGNVGTDNNAAVWKLTLPGKAVADDSENLEMITLTVDESAIESVIQTTPESLYDEPPPRATEVLKRASKAQGRNNDSRKKKRLLVAPEGMCYTEAENETPSLLAKRHKVNVGAFVTANLKRFPGLKRNSKLFANTGPFVIPKRDY